MRAWRAPRTDVRHSTEKPRRCSQGSDSGGTSVSSALIRAFPYSPRGGAPRGAPDLRPGRGRCRGLDEAARASRLRDPSAPTPRTPRSRVAGSGVAGKRAASGDSVPAQAPRCPGQSRVSPAGPLGCGVAQPPREGRGQPLGPVHSRQRAEKPCPAADESLRSASPPFPRKSNSENVVPYLPARLPPVTFALWKLGQK